MSKPPLPQPELDPQPITSEQYFEYTPEKLELWSGFYEYGGEDFTGFHLGILRNMGLRQAVKQCSLSLWLEVIATQMRHDLEATGNTAMLPRLEQGLAELEAVMQCLATHAHNES